MSPKANPTDAKTIALYFINLTQTKVTASHVARTIKMVKSLQVEGFTTDEIMYTIDKVLSKKADVFSFGYISASIMDVLRERKEEETKASTKKQADEVRSLIASSSQEEMQSEVLVEDESTRRNREKATRNSVQPRFGKKSYFDMFEG